VNPPDANLRAVIEASNVFETGLDPVGGIKKETLVPDEEDSGR
jgi:hypothetical protein